MNLSIRQKLPLVILLVFATVAPVSVHGEDTVYINNSVQSSVSTGGYSSDGASGQDGADGTSGMDGHDGADGAPGRIIEGNGSAKVEVTSNVSGASVTTRSATSSREAGASATTSLHTTVGSSAPASTTGTSETTSVLQNFVLKIREFFLTYVSIF